MNISEMHSSPLAGQEKLRFPFLVQIWEIQFLASAIGCLILKTTALDFRSCRTQSMPDSWHWLVSRYVPEKHQKLVLTHPHLSSSIFIHNSKNRTQSQDRLRKQHSGDYFTQYNFPIQQQSFALLLLSGKQTVMKWHNGRNHWHGYREIPTIPYVKPSQEMEQFAGKKMLQKSNKSVLLMNLSSNILLK